MKKIAIFILCNIIFFKIYSQSFVQFSGYITGKNDGESLVGAVVYDAFSGKISTSNGYGYYSLAVQKGKSKIICSYTGYKTDTLLFQAINDTTLDISLDLLNYQLSEVTVYSNDFFNVLQSNEYKSIQLSSKQIKQLPSVFGEKDLVKAVQLQSGVKTMGDGASGIFIRGGSSDQNLLLIDEAPVYNPSHMFGLISVFNPDAINHVSLYKSNMPAQYGGRVSAVIDCKLKEGNKHEHKFSAGFSPLAFTTTISGPLVKEKAAYLISARKSWVDLVFTPGDLFDVVPGFYDINIKMNTTAGKKNKLFLSVYQGSDIVLSGDSLNNTWGNYTATLRWNRTINKRLFSNVSVILSNYKNNIEYTDNKKLNSWNTGLKDINTKMNFTYNMNEKNTIKAGIGSVYHRFIPGESNKPDESISRVQAFEHSAYISNDKKISNNIGINYGTYFSIFQNTGKALWYNYNEKYEPVSITTREKGIYKTFVNVEPRISANIRVKTNVSVKLAYSRNVQYLQILQNSTLSYSALETWFPANHNIDPVKSDAFSVGYFEMLNKTYSFSAELYYKNFRNQIDFINHAQLVNNPYIIGQIRKGKAMAYGAEFALSKKTGRLTGEISYVYSKSLRKVEGINSGEKYNSPYDIPHDLRVNSLYQMGMNWSISAVWLFTSGRPFTVPVAYYEYFMNIVPVYTKRNEGRLPVYHRLDLALNYNNYNKRNKKTRWNFSIGAYNVYARKNPISYNLEYDFYSSGVVAYEYFLFGFVPNIALKVEF